jgi:hypothetical protein
VRIEGVVCADDVELVRWITTDPQGAADQIEELMAILEDAGYGHDSDDYRIPEGTLADIEEKMGGEAVIGTRSRNVEERLPTIVEGLRSQQPKRLRQSSSLNKRLAEIEKKLDELEDSLSRRLASVEARLDDLD